MTDIEPLAIGMALTREPAPGPPGIEVRAVASFDDVRAASRIAGAAFGFGSEPEAALEERRWAEYEPDRSETFLALLDGRPVASATATYAEAAAVLFGGATLPDSRGRGAYRALVRARWDEAVPRGTPALVTARGGNVLSDCSGSDSASRPRSGSFVTTTSARISRVRPMAQRTETELCMRCGAEMDWRHGTWQCSKCRFKLGCCEGDAGECSVPPPSPPN